MRRFAFAITGFLLTTGLLQAAAIAGVEVAASESLTIQPNGPRAGEAGHKYFNVEGKDNTRFSSFGVLVFDLPKEVQGKKPKRLELTLVQSVARFSKDGALKILVAPSFDPKAELKFDPEAPGGTGTRITPLLNLGVAEFKKAETGKIDTVALTVDAAVGDLLARGGKLYLVLVPADATVAATFFGVAPEGKDKSPRLTLELP